MEVRQGATPAPEFNSAQGVMGQITSTMNSLKGHYQTLNALMRDLAQTQANQPAAPNTAGMEEKDAKKVLSDFQNKMKEWKSNVTRLQRDIGRTQKKITADTRKLGKLQNVDLPRAENKDQGDMKKWQEDQQKALEAISDGAQQEQAVQTVGGEDNVVILRSEIKKLEQASNDLGTLLAQSQLNDAGTKTIGAEDSATKVNTEQKKETERAIAGGPARFDGLTMP